MSFVAGVDGCRAGWVVALRSTTSGAFSFRVVPAFADVLALAEKPELVAVDIPIGLLDAAVPGGRACEKEARAMLGPRRSSVFSAPVRAALNATNYATACAANIASSPSRIGLSKQSVAIIPKILEVDVAMTPALQDRIVEVHPELCFSELSGGSPAAHPKRGAAGARERFSRLSTLGYPSAPALGRGVGVDDVLDALAACWTAERARGGSATRIPSRAPTDSRGLRMELWR